ncbi:CLUMA_CG000506, isoform A [Clunio marinus]|uniref:Carboxylic ester hydrolase n=1 Tax=Clunio marinus TaxID=568069 RepID=A0A1J1HJM2_9DIPT|nr:CLUMA_CG000506, isoform A [Clunio marinus]
MLLKLVLAFLSVCAISSQILPPTTIRRVRPGPTINTPVGPIQGQEETYDLFRRMYTFKGIRYAQAPIGNLRFRQGVPPPPFQQTFQAWDYGSRCPQFSLLLERYEGDEDCLFLNIATPTNIRSRLPVVVLIHGGGLVMGHGEMGLLGPEHIVHENVIYVSFNYRLNVLGFMNTGDRNSPGNFGFKDMIMALQWVRNNIESFGGNPNDVTILGGSGGAVAVQALVVTPVAAGLFHKAIAQSGSLFNNWAFNRNPISLVQMLVSNLELQVTDNVDLMNQLREVSPERLLRNAGILTDRNPRLFEELSFVASVDAVDSLEPRIFTAPISDLVRTGNINQVPFMIGFNSFESLYAVTDIANDATILERLNQNPHLLVPSEWNLTPGSAEAAQVINVFRQLYFNGSPVITNEMALGFAEYVSDREFIFGVSKMARLHLTRQPIYYFRFSFSGALNLAKRGLGLMDIPGAMHGDDIFYLMRLNRAATPVLPSDEAYTIQRRYVRMWTNFMKYSTPTPTTIDPLIRVIWPPMTSNTEFMEIGQDLTVDSEPFNVRMRTWELFDQLFNP